MFNIDPTLALISRDLDACDLRQAVYATNVANANTPGYRPLEVHFEASLRAAAQAAEGMPADAQQVMLDSVQPTVTPGGASTVELDQQVALMAQNAIRYETLVNAFERSTSLLRLAILEGKNG